MWRAKLVILLKKLTRFRHRALVRILKIPVQKFFSLMYIFSNSMKIFFFCFITLKKNPTQLRRCQRGPSFRVNFTSCIIWNVWKFVMKCLSWRIFLKSSNLPIFHCRNPKDACVSSDYLKFNNGSIKALSI